MTPIAWKEKYIDGNYDEVTKKHFNEGSFLDSLLFEPDTIDQYYYVSHIKLPSEGVQKIIDKYYNFLLKTESYEESYDLTINDNIKALIEFARDENYGNDSYSDERIVKELTNKGGEYFKFLYERAGRTLITLEFNMAAIEMVDNIKKDKYVTKVMYAGAERSHLMLTGRINNTVIKGELDHLSIDIENKIINIIDLKKCLNVNFFKYDARKYNYGLQQSFYTELVIQNLKYLEEIFGIDNLNEYIIHNYNLVIDDRHKYPMLLKYYSGVYADYKYGIPQKAKGWLQDIDEIDRCIAYNDFSHNPTYENNRATLADDLIYENFFN